MVSLLSAMLIMVTLTPASSATAANLELIFTGTTSGSDYTGEIFGAGTNFANVNYTATFFYDTSLGIRYTPSGGDILKGGDAWGTVVPVTADITIDGKTLSFGGPLGSTGTWDAGADLIVGNSIGAYVHQDLVTATQMYFGVFTPSGVVIPANLEDPFKLSFTPVANNSYFIFNNWEPSKNNYAHITGNLNVDSVAIVASAVPEPETYVMLLAGLGLIGLIAVRRGKSSAMMFV